MKRSVLILTVLALALTACSSNETSSNKDEKAVPAASQQVKEETGTVSVLNKKHLKFDESVDTFLGDKVESVLPKMEPLLMAASGTVHEKQIDFYSEVEPFNADFVWTMIYMLRHDYSSRGIGKIKADTGDLVITEEQMKKCFGSAVKGFNGQIPEVPDSLAEMVTFDKDSQSYLLAARDDEKIDFELRDITLSKANSAEDPTQSMAVWIDILSPDGERIETACVEVLRNADSDYGFSVQSTWLEKGEEQNQEVQSTPQGEEAGYAVYSNTEVGFSVPYPDNGYSIAESDAGDGATFTVNDNEAFKVWGQYNVTNETGESILREMKNNVAYIIDENADDTSFSLTYEGGNADGSGTILFYEYGIIQGDKMVRFQFKYPSELKDKYNNIIPYIITHLVFE